MEVITGKSAPNPAARHASGVAHAYRPEIDGLRAIAVIAVLINHLNPAWLPGGYLGVDLFFVISGYVVTGSLLGRQTVGPKSLLLGFYRRRFRRLMPALIVTILVVSVLFANLVHPGDDNFTPVLRSGITALFGISNLYLLKQGSNYFGNDNHFNPFLHTWSLGVEEQFYLVWPLILLLCGIGLRSDAALRNRLACWSIALSMASLLLLFDLQVRGENSAAFYLMPTRFWELAAGTLALLRRLSGKQSGSDKGKHFWLSGCLLLALVGVFWLPESMRLQGTFACVAISAALLSVVDAKHGIGLWLSKSWPLLIGRSSYSLYLWHWPVIVLARWSVGLHLFTLPPILTLIALLTALSYRLENHFRRPGRNEQRTLLRYPLLALASAGGISLLTGPARGALFLGDRSRLGTEISINSRIPGTRIDRLHCFRDPTDPLSSSEDDRFCRVQRHPGRPTLFFEGDSHTEALLPLGESLLQDGNFNLAFFARGGCPVPFFSPLAEGRDRLTRYRLCSRDTGNRLDRRLKQISPGDRLVLVTNLPGYLLGAGGAEQASIAAHSRSVRELARRLEDRGAELILFGPLPGFPQRPSMAAPSSLCLPEWYRPSGWREPACAPSTSSRSAMLRTLQPVEEHLRRLEADIPNLHVFRPFSILCPPDAGACSTHRRDVMLFKDSNHLSGQGARLLKAPFLRFLASQSSGTPAKPARAQFPPTGP